MELKEYSVEEIVGFIEGEPQIGQVPVEPGITEKITGTSSEDNVPNEGYITYDIRTYINIPKLGNTKILINIEAQKRFSETYDLVTRAIFYAARMISAQKDTEFQNSHYDDIKKVYSIWICSEPNSKSENTITEYNIQPNYIYGKMQSDSRYDLMSVVFICLNKASEITSGTEVHQLLNTLFSDSLTRQEKSLLMQERFHIKGCDVEKEVNTMCNLSDLIEEKSIAKGIEQGKIEGISLLVDAGVITEEIAAKSLGMTVTAFLEARKNIINIKA